MAGAGTGSRRPAPVPLANEPYRSYGPRPELAWGNSPVATIGSTARMAQDPPAASPVRVLLADDHPIVRDGLRALLGRWPEVRIVGEAGDGASALALCRRLRPDLVLLDAALPDVPGREVHDVLRRELPQTRIVVFTGVTGSSALTEWMDAGVEGLFLKGSGLQELEVGLRTILEGGRVIPRSVRARLGPGTPTLTRREREVLELVIAGLTTREIGTRLHISAKTVEKHRAKLLDKFGATSVAGLLREVFRNGYLDHLRPG